MLETNNLLQFFEKLEEYQWVVMPISMVFAQDLLKSAEKRLANGEFREAGISNLIDKSSVEKSIRSDSIYWLDPSTPFLSEAESAILKALQHLQTDLSDFFRIRLDHFEVHYAVYQPGQAYAKHSDQKKVNNKRFFSFVIYLNQNWLSQDGGALIGYNKKQDKIFEIQPQMGQAIVFRSDLEHEVRKANRTRWSLTGWFRTA